MRVNLRIAGLSGPGLIHTCGGYFSHRTGSFSGLQHSPGGGALALSSPNGWPSTWSIPTPTAAMLADITYLYLANVIPIIIGNRYTFFMLVVVVTPKDS